MSENIIDYNIFLPQNNGEISSSITQSWTLQAVECWELKGDCSCCSIKKGEYSFVCQMPKVVKLLEDSLGAPYGLEEEIPFAS